MNNIDLINSWSSLGGPLGAAVLLGWWLSGRFRKTELTLENKLDEHEEKDAQRHDENIGKFENIYITLARMGNGKKYGKH